MSYGTANDTHSHVKSEEEEQVDMFVYSHGLSTAEANEIFRRVGPNELPEKSVPRWYTFISLFWQPMPIMIWIAVIIEALIGNYDDMGILLFIQFANASIAFYETTKAEDAVAKLKSTLKPRASVKRDGKWIDIDATKLVPGDLVALANGANIPADCRINEHTVDVDESQLNGESLPRTVVRGDQVMMGSVIVRGECEATVECTGADTFFGRTASLLQVS
jgi:H+-transporting ATPase